MKPRRGEIVLLSLVFMGLILILGGSPVGCGKDDTQSQSSPTPTPTPAIMVRCEERVPDYAPPGRGLMCYDQQRQTLVLFTSMSTPQIWEWHAGRWLRNLLPGIPDNLAWFTVAYFPARAAILFLGSKYNDVAEPRQPQSWLFDGTSWQEVSPSDNPNFPGGMMAFDPNTQQMLYTGGDSTYTSAGFDSDTHHNDFDIWAFDGTIWRKIFENTVMTQSATSMGLVRDDNRNRLVLTIDYDQGCGSVYANTYEFDGQTWILMNGSEAMWNNLFYDQDTTRVYAITPTGSAYSRKYVYEPPDWIFLEQEQHEFGETSAYIQEERAIYSFMLPLTLRYSFDRGWENVTDPTQPANHEGSDGAYFPEMSGMIMLVSPYSGASPAKLQNWLWDGVSFTRLTAVPGLDNHSMEYFDDGYSQMIYDEAEHRILFFPGFYYIPTVWSFDGVTWRNVTPQSVGFEQVYSARLVWFPPHQAVLAFFTYYLSSGHPHAPETWEFRNDAWQLLSPTESPPGRYYSHLAYREATGTAVLFGGETDYVVLNDTWEFNGQTWQRIETTHAPPPRMDGTMVSLGERGTILLIGGYGNDWVWGDVWEYDGVDWQHIECQGIKPRRSGAVGVFDPVRERVIVCGGYADQGIHASLLELWSEPAE